MPLLRQCSCPAKTVNPVEDCATAPPTTLKQGLNARKHVCSLFQRVIISLSILVTVSGTDALIAANLTPIPQLGVSLASGFRISVYAGPDLANDIYAMTLDAAGNVVVTSQGYIKKLYDTDGDGRADTETLFGTTEKGGMGLCVDGSDLYFSGDGGVFRFQDANQDGVADGPPERLFGIGAGEHGGHANRKGPDGWLYLIGGNDAGFGPPFINKPRPTIRDIETRAVL